MAHAYAQVTGRAILLASLGLWLLASAAIDGAAEHGASVVGGGGLVAIATLYLVWEHRRTRSIDNRTERLISHLEKLAGITDDDDESDDNDDDRRTAA